MKPGAGDDLLSEDDIDAEVPVEEPDELEDPDRIDPDAKESVTEPEIESAGVAPGLPQPGALDDGIPWVYTRSNVKQDRDMVQYYLRRSVQEAEEDLVDEVADQLGADVSKTDVREAAVVAAMRQPDLVAEELERWGFESE